MSRREGAIPYFRDASFTELVVKWGLRALIRLKVERKLPYSIDRMLCDDIVLQTVGLDRLIDKEISRVDFRRIIIRELRKTEAKPDRADSTLRRNIAKLGEILQMNPAEQEVLFFVLILKMHGGLQAICKYLGELTSEMTIQALSVILDNPVSEVRYVFSTESILFRSGIMRMDRNRLEALHSKIDLISGYDILFEQQSDIEEVLRNFFRPVTEGSLALDDYLHIEQEVRLATKYLAQAIHDSSRGVNILFYGPPGTGKTELAKTIAGNIQSNLYEIPVNSFKNEPLPEKERLDSYRLTQEVLAAKPRTLLLFDEVENLLAGGMHLYLLFGHYDNIPTKAVINKLLEENKVPAIWIANSIEGVDRAFIRRFDFILRLDHPPQSVREKIIHKHLAGLPVSGRWIQAVAENGNISPAVIASASKVVAAVSTEQEIETHLELILGSSLSAMGYQARVTARRGDTLPYNLEAVNPDSDLPLLLERLKKRPEARLCLYGPPGTGKTQFGHHLAQFLDRRLMARRASDILDRYVGGTEANIARMFSEARQEEAVLLLDEADSFLRDRNYARQQWEVSQVNELLTQMEEYDGIFICSTNLMDSLDAASLRRFDLKIKFDYLNPEQACLLFRQLLEQWQAPGQDDTRWKEQIGRLGNLTPGDFATVARQAHLGAVEPVPDKLLASLAREAELKPGYSPGKRFGFAA